MRFLLASRGGSAGHRFHYLGDGPMVVEALAAAHLGGDGLSVEVIDIRSVQPFDTETAVASLKKTHRALVVHEAVRFGGFGGEIVAQLQEAFDYLMHRLASGGTVLRSLSRARKSVCTQRRR